MVRWWTLVMWLRFAGGLLADCWCCSAGVWIWHTSSVWIILCFGCRAHNPSYSNPTSWTAPFKKQFQPPSWLPRMEQRKETSCLHSPLCSCSKLKTFASRMKLQFALSLVSSKLQNTCPIRTNNSCWPMLAMDFWMNLFASLAQPFVICTLSSRLTLLNAATHHWTTFDVHLTKMLNSVPEVRSILVIFLFFLVLLLCSFHYLTRWCLLFVVFLLAGGLLSSQCRTGWWQWSPCIQQRGCNLLC